MPNSQLKFHRGITLERLDKFTSSSLFQDVNLFSRLYARRDGSSVSLQAYAVPDLKRITFDEAMRALPEYRAAKVGDVFGPAWATVWIRVEVTVPAGWVGEEVHFLWDAGNEGMVWTVGMPMSLACMYAFRNDANVICMRTRYRTP